ncbi:MAG: transporter substrate-binding domain-containing protein [Eubacterium sp.]|nr:transporter substrate-binding domain-containing protein [Eubacterium sp.]
MKKVLSVLLAVLMVFSVVTLFAACSKDTPENVGTAESDLAYVQDKGKMVIGITEYAPMNYYEDTAKTILTGFDTEFAQAVCEKLGVEAEFIIIDWDNKWPELEAKSIDAVWNGMTITDEVKANSSVTNAYVKNAQVVVMKADVAANYTSLDQMTDLTFAVESGSAGEGVLKDAGMGNYTAVVDQSAALMEVESGSADACVIDITMAEAMTGEGTSYSDLAQAVSLNEEEYGIAFRTGSDLTAKVNEIMDEMKADGSLQALADKYSLSLV